MEVRTAYIRQDLNTAFEHVIQEIDFEAIYEHDEIYSEIPLDNVAEKIESFISELDDQDLSQFDSDVIGRIYEGVIPAEQRHEMGEYYTPPAICDLISELTIENASDDVFDPACGSGGFLVSAYNQKRDLYEEPQGSHTTIIEQIYGCEINRFPAHLSAINLAIQDLSAYTSQVNIEVSDFFDVTPDTLRFGRKRASASGEEDENGLVATVGDMDAVVGNPPYIRQENIKNKANVREHLPHVDGDFLSKRSDIYSYFITHSTEFLKDGGRLGFITSDRWLDTKYGADLQNFILDHYTVDAIIKFGRQTFEDALVGSCVVIFTKEPDESARKENIAKFIQVNEAIDVGQIASIVQDDTEPNQMVRTEDYRLVTRKQGALRNEEKWSVFFNAPPIYFDLVGHPDLVELEEVADVSRGFTSGANDFFHGRGEEWDELGIKEYTRPLLKASGQVDKIEFSGDIADEWGYLAVHDLVQKALSDDEREYQDIREGKEVKEWLLENGHDSLAEYIEWGEDQGYHERRTTAARDVWFDLGDIEPPSIVMTDFTWREYRVIWNEVGALGTSQFYYVVPEDDVDDKLLCSPFVFS